MPKSIYKIKIISVFLHSIKCCNMEDGKNISLWRFIDKVVDNMKSGRLADVFRIVSFYGNESFGPHNHLRIEINYVKKGKCIMEMGNECVTFDEGETMVVLPNAIHKFTAGPKGTTLIQLEFLPELMQGFGMDLFEENEGEGEFNLFSSQHTLIKIVSSNSIYSVIRHIINELDNKRVYHKHLVVMLYAELMLIIYRHMKENILPLYNNESLKDAVIYIRRNYTHDISQAQIAESAGISDRYLRMLFKKHFGINPLDFLTQIRINKSIELLKNTDMSIKEIGYKCGFNSPQYFCKVFKEKTGISPRDIKKL